MGVWTIVERSFREREREKEMRINEVEALDKNSIKQSSL